MLIENGRISVFTINGIDIPINPLGSQSEGPLYDCAVYFQKGFDLWSSPVSQMVINDRHFDPRLGLACGSIADLFVGLAEEATCSSRQNIHTARGAFLRYLVVKPDIFLAIRVSQPSPSWSGSYTWWDGTVVYNYEYLKSALGGGGQFGGEQWSYGIFLREHRHESSHGYACHFFCDRDEPLARFV